MTPTTSAIVSRSVNLTSATLARMVCVRSDTISDLDRGRNGGLELRQRLLDEVHGLDHIGAGLALDREKDRRGRTQPGAERRILGRNHRAADIADTNRGAVHVSQNVVVEPARGQELIVGRQRVSVLAAVEYALRLIDCAVGERRSHRFEIEPFRGKLGRVELDPDRRILLAADADQTDAGHLRELLRQNAVGVVADLGDRKRIRGERDQQDRRVGRIGLPVDRRIEQICGQLARRCIDRRLDGLGVRVNRLTATELERDLHIAERAARRHLRQARDLAELSLELRCDR